MQSFHDTLNKNLWNKEELKPEVAKKLKEIAKAFIEFLEVPEEAIRDVVITGSCASYNYTPQSDIDLHLLVDFDKVHKDCPIVGNYLLSKKSEFNNNHDIFIYGIPVEVYAESIDNENVHNGLYSIKNDKWIDKPQKLKPVDNDVAVNAKYKEFEEAAENVGDGKIANELIQKIKKMRKAGLEKAGEFSVENLVFKKLRNNGIIGKLMNIKKEEFDKELSLKETYENLIGCIEEMMGMGSTAVMAPYPTPVVYQEQPTQIEKQGKKREKSAMLGYKYQKSRNKSALVESMIDLVDVCEAISEVIAEGRVAGESQADYKARLQSKYLPALNTEIAMSKAIERRARKEGAEAKRGLKKAEKDPYSKSYPIKSLMYKDKMATSQKLSDELSNRIKDLVAKRNKIK